MYTAHSQYKQMEIGLRQHGGIVDVDTIAGTVGNFESTLPTFEGKVMAAFLDFLPGTVINTAAGVNWTEPEQYIQIRPNAGAGAWHNAITLWSASFYFPGAGTYVMERYYGSTDIGQWITSGDIIQWRWNLATAHADLLEFSNLQCVLRIYLR